MFVVLLLMNIKVFLYQRTVKKISIKYNIPQKSLVVLYPESYLKMYSVSKIRWVLLVAIFIINWIAGLFCLFSEWLLPIIVPSQNDYKNLKRSLHVLAEKDIRDFDKLRMVIGRELSKLDVELPYHRIGTEVNLKMADGTVLCGTVIDVDDKYNQGCVVSFDNDVSIYNSFPRKKYVLNESVLNDMMCSKIEGSYTHFIIR